MTVSVCIPHLPFRTDMLARALGSVFTQRCVPDEVLVASDVSREGAAATRNRAIAMASGDYLAFLDDDDELHPQHIEVLVQTALDTGADLVYPWFDLSNGSDPFRLDGEPLEHRPFDDRARECILHEANFIPVTVLVRRELVCDLGCFPTPYTERWPYGDCEDWGLWKDMLRAGASFVHVPMRTWTWHWHGANTSGRSDR